MNQQHSGGGDNIGGNKNEQTTNNLPNSQFGGGAAGRDYTGDVNQNKNEYNYNYYVSPQNQQQRDKNQQELIKYIGETVDRLLSQSLRNQVYITLNKIKDDGKVTASMAIKFAHQQAQPLPPETTIVEVFDRKDINGRLLILGDPGSGKSTNLYKLVQELVIRAKADINHPIPILFNLSSWTSNYTTIKDWLIDELNIIGFSKKLARQYLQDELIIPLLDGLDELQSDRQTACVEAINTFLLPANWKKPLVVCSRIKEFELLQTRIGLNGAVILQPLTIAQINNYLQQAQANKIQQLIANDEDWRDLAKTPLFLDIMVLASKTLNLSLTKDLGKSKTPQQWQNLSTKVEKLSVIWEGYLDAMLNPDYWQNQYQTKIKNSPKGRQKTLKSYLKKYIVKPQQTRHYLTWLAQKLSKDKQTVFLIEKLQPTHLPNGKQRLIYGLIGWLIEMLIVVPLFVKLSVPLSIVLIYMIYMLIVGLYFGVKNNSKINTVEQIQWSWPKSIYELIGRLIGVPIFVLTVGLRASLIGGLIFGLIFGLRASLIGGLIFGLRVGIRGGIGTAIGIGILMLIFGLIFAIGWRPGGELEAKRTPNQGIKASINNTLLTLGIVLILEVLLYGVFVFFSPWLNQIDEGLFIGLRNTLLYSVFMIPLFLGGGIAVLQHFALRLVLAFNGYSPWNYARFLDYCTEQLLLQRIGGGYRFIHRLLQEHLIEFRMKN